MAQDKLTLFPLIFSVSLLLITIAGTLLFVSQLFIPAWQLLLGLSNPWYCSIFVLFLCPLIGMIRIPIALRLKGRSGSVNLLTTLLPLSILLYTYPTVQINWSTPHFIPAILSMILFWVSSFPSPKGGTLYRVSIIVGAVATVIFLNSILGNDIRAFLWMAFASQFVPLLVVDVIRTTQSTQFLSEGEEFILGGRNAHDPLWVSPSFTIFLAYSAHLLFWDFTPPLLG
jgi:hypothetical protein